MKQFLCGLIFAILIAFVFCSCIHTNNVPDEYWETVPNGGSIEALYAALGDYSVRSVEYASGERSYSSYKVWFPAQLEGAQKTYPLVVFANGTGVPYTLQAGDLLQ